MILNVESLLLNHLVFGQTQIPPFDVLMYFFISVHKTQLEWIITTKLYSQNMSNHESTPERKLRVATRVFKSSEDNLKLSDAMKIAGYKTPERKGGTIYQRVCRTAQKMLKNLDSASSNVPPSV